jgi:hypothetical protein
MGGTKARSAFFNNPDIRTAIQYSGKDSTFETMRNSGLDITSFQWMGLNMGFMDLPIFNDPNFNPNQSQVTNANIDSSTFYIMAVDQTVDIKGQQLPFAQIIHFDESPEAKYFYVGGTVGTIGAGASAGLSATQFSASGYDGVTAHVQFDGGINISDASGIAKGYMAI